METEKLYLNDSLLLAFEAQVSGHGSFNDAPSVHLDRSAFYGESGGQLGDQGTLQVGDQTWRVVDCQYDEAGSLHHILDATDDLPAVGAAVQGEVAFARRRDMMSQHTGQHLLSAVFERALDAPTISSRLGSKISTLDIDLDSVSDGQLQEVAAKVNELILANRAVRPHYPDAEQLAAMNLRRLPKVTKNIRIMEIEGYDFTPCGGTHCRATGEIGPLYITSKERYKGKVRLSFLCGDRVLSRLQNLDRRLEDMGEMLGCGHAGVEEAVVKLQKTLKEQNTRLGAARSSLLQKECAEIYAQYPAPESGPTLLTLLRPAEDLDSLRALGAALARRADMAVMVIGKDEKSGGWRVIIDAGSESGFSAGNWFKTTGRELGGRGGGRPQHAEGTFGADVDPSSLSLGTIHAD